MTPTMWTAAAGGCPALEQLDMARPPSGRESARRRAARLRAAIAGHVAAFRRVGVVLALAALVACANARHQTLRVALTATVAADVAFVEVNKAKLNAIVADTTTKSYEEDLAKVEVWEAKSDPVLARIRLAYQLIAAAALDTDTSLDEVLAVVAGIVDSVNKLRGEP